MKNFTDFFLLSLLHLLLLSMVTLGDCGCDAEELNGERSRAIPLKIKAIFSILFAGAAGVCISSAGNWLPALRPEKEIFFALKAFAAGVILATGFIHILPDAFESLTSPCLSPSPWHDFPFAGFFTMLSAIVTLAVDTMATAYFSRACDDGKVAEGDEEKAEGEGGATDVRVHTHATHGHAHGATSSLGGGGGGGGDLIRHKVISQVLEIGIVVHSVIIGISLGASDSPSTIKPLVAALSFHQFFEGMGLGGCLALAQFKMRSMITMILFFSLTTPVGIAIGFGISSVYNENSPSALIIEGILNSVAAGILIYMALVDLLAADFMSPKVQKNGNLQILINISLLLGAGLMSILAKWA